MDVDSAPLALGRLGARLAEHGWAGRDRNGRLQGDGHSDILWQNASGQAAIWEMNGNTIAGGGLLSPNPGPSWDAVGLT